MINIILAASGILILIVLVVIIEAINPPDLPPKF